MRSAVLTESKLEVAIVDMNHFTVTVHDSIRRPWFRWHKYAHIPVTANQANFAYVHNFLSLSTSLCTLKAKTIFIEASTHWQDQLKEI